MPDRTTPRNIDEYISAAPTRCQLILQRIRKTIRETAPRAEECISYGMPTRGRRVIYNFHSISQSHIH
jgi:uncharacterized protein YdhG (YjbR/CyaY superfamily)